MQTPSRSTVPNNYPQSAELFTSIDDSTYTSRGTISMSSNFPSIYTIELSTSILSKYVRIKLDNSGDEGLGRFHVNGYKE